MSISDYFVILFPVVLVVVAGRIHRRECKAMRDLETQVKETARLVGRIKS